VALLKADAVAGLVPAELDKWIEVWYSLRRKMRRGGRQTALRGGFLVSPSFSTHQIWWFGKGGDHAPQHLNISYPKISIRRSKISFGVVRATPKKDRALVRRAELPMEIGKAYPVTDRFRT